MPLRRKSPAKSIRTVPHPTLSTPLKVIREIGNIGIFEKEHGHLDYKSRLSGDDLRHLSVAELEQLRGEIEAFQSWRSSRFVLVPTHEIHQNAYVELNGQICVVDWGTVDGLIKEKSGK